MISIYLTALGLSMDAFAVALSNGMCAKGLRIRHAFLFGLYFGFFQFLMPIIGCVAGNAFSAYIKSIDHWVAFILLSYIGIKMIHETLGEKEEACGVPAEVIIKPKNMIFMAIATSIDAMAVGISFSLLSISIVKPSVVTGIITFILSFAGAFFGKKIGNLFQKSACRFGGTILILMGVKILTEHLYYHHIFHI